MLLYLVRHGKTSLNNSNLVQGTIDAPLSLGGYIQAQKLAEHLRLVPFTEAWTSPLTRAQETAKVILSQQPSRKAQLHVDDRLGARYMGTAEGKHWDEVKDDLEAHKAEDGDVVKARLHEWLTELLNTHAPSISAPRSPTSPLSPLPPLSSFSPSSYTSSTGNFNPFDLIHALPRPGFPRRPSSRSSSGATGLVGGSGSGVILVLTHQECLERFGEMCNRDESVVKNGEREAKAKVPLSMYVSEGIDLKSSPMGNTSVAILRVWWQRIDSGAEMGSVLEARGRLEAWGMEDHLD
ncbi:hypothetical protein CNK03130 [Cryptococcus deneoformans JEC21]|uniref:Phosphoglycerate mutase n=1 Tax=Cryptococcus deneoformans (strain JEC21 / ATCC MYA-565) TaxID=214684 RepID=Q5K956_CRYD1|nr:hypothetical protein CNK03130 [Cryptococcus neoformans var. neoformans JEC21]AAW46246.2 hypothetical protein CNK03130 [Cryptococcus neoformans var. neoformans JEC21]